MKRALVYGHSQAQPTGMGDDMVKALKARGVKVDRLGLQGRNDAKLLAESDQLGDLSGYDRVFLYAGGNNDKPSPDDLRKLVEHFGASRTTVILSPVNTDGQGSRSPEVRRPISVANRAGVQDLVTAYEIEAPGSSFKPDGIHLRAGSPEGKALVERILTDLGAGGAPAGAGGSSTLLLVLAAVLGLYLLRR